MKYSESTGTKSHAPASTCSEEVDIPVGGGQQFRRQLEGNSRSQGLQDEQALDRKWGDTEGAFTGSKNEAKVDVY